MKMFIKTVCITLCISVTALFFSSYKKVEAVAETLIASSVAVAIGAIVSYICSSVADYINSSLDNLSADIIADLKWDKMEKDRIAAEATQKVNAYLNSPEYRQKIMEELQPTETISEIPISDFIDAQAYFSSISSPNTADKLGYAALKALENSTKTITVDTVNNKCSLNTPISSDIVSSAYNFLLSSSGAAAGSLLGISSAISTINGKPQKATTVYSPQVIEAFEDLEINYTMTPSITDVHLYCRWNVGLPENISLSQYYGFFVISNGNLYLLGNAGTSFASLLQFTWDSYYSSPSLTMSNFFTINKSSSPSSPYIPSNRTQEMKLCEVDGRFCVAFYQYYINSNGNQAYEQQVILGNPEPTLYPKLFERPVLSSSPSCSITFTNRQIDNMPCFYNILDSNDVLSENDVLSGNYECCGYIEGSSIGYFTSTNNLGTAARIICQQSTSVSGGEKTVYSELSDIEKAIYALAQQQGITYEEMLEQCNIMINENGEMYLESLDGVTQSIDSLIAEFEKLLEQGDISNEQGAAMIEQLTALLTYLKSLNIEGIGSYIANIEAILDGLNQRNEDQSALLGDVVLQLQGLNAYLDSLGLSAALSDITKIKSDTQTISEAIQQSIKEEEERRKKDEEFKNKVLLHIVPVATQYKLYDQCKYLLDNLFNYEDRNTPPDLRFYWDSDGDGIQEIYNPIDFSILETKLSNENLVDKSWFPVEIKIIDVIRYVIAIVIYGLFVMRLLKRLPTFYGFSFLSYL